MLIPNLIPKFKVWLMKINALLKAIFYSNVVDIDRSYVTPR
jgi:hypothetical protein